MGILESTNDQQWSQQEETIMQVSKGIIALLCLCILLLFAVNTYYFLLKQRKYRVPTILLFYMIGIPLTICVLSYTLMIPMRNYCHVGWVVAYYGGAFLNTILGIVQASNISILGFRLHYQEKVNNYAKTVSFRTDSARFMQSSGVAAEEITNQAKEIYQRHLRYQTAKKLQLAQKWINIVMTVGMSILFILAIFLMIYLTHIIRSQEEDVCMPDVWSSASIPQLTNFYFWFAICRLSISSLIVMYLILATCLTMRLIKRYLPADQQKEASQVGIIYTCFIVCYSFWLIYDIYDAISIKLSGFPDPFLDQLLSMVLPFIWDILPVLIVLLLHLKIMILTKRQEQRPESELKDNLSVYKSASVPTQEEEPHTLRLLEVLSIRSLRSESESTIGENGVSSDTEKVEGNEDQAEDDDEQLLKRVRLSLDDSMCHMLNQTNELISVRDTQPKRSHRSTTVPVADFNMSVLPEHDIECTQTETARPFSTNRTQSQASNSRLMSSSSQKI